MLQWWELLGISMYIPNGINLIPGLVKMGIAIRGSKNEKIPLIKQKIMERLKHLQNELQLEINYHIATELPPQS